jgi:hypothetical protein
VLSAPQNRNTFPDSGSPSSVKCHHSSRSDLKPCARITFCSMQPICARTQRSPFHRVGHERVSNKIEGRAHIDLGARLPDRSMREIKRRPARMPGALRNVAKLEQPAIYRRSDKIPPSYFDRSHRAAQRTKVRHRALRSITIINLEPQPARRQLSLHPHQRLRRRARQNTNRRLIPIDPAAQRNYARPYNASPRASPAQHALHRQTRQAAPAPHARKRRERGSKQERTSGVSYASPYNRHWTA